MLFVLLLAAGFGSSAFGVQSVNAPDASGVVPAEAGDPEESTGDEFVNPPEPKLAKTNAITVSEEISEQTKEAAEPEEGSVIDLTQPLDVVKTLHGALMAAYSNNPELVQLRQNFRTSLEGVNQAQAAFMPRITGEVGANYGESIKSGTAKNGSTASAGVGGGLTNSTSAGLTLQQNLFNGWASVAQLRDAECDVQLAAYQMKSKEQEIFMNVIETYLELIRLRGDIEALKSSEKATYTNLEVAQNKLTIGEETRTQVALAEARLADVQARSQVSVALLCAAQEAFVSLTGRRIAQELIEPKLPEQDLAQLDGVLAQMESNLDIVLAQVAYRQSQAKVDKAKGEAWYPTVDVTARSQRQGARTEQTYQSSTTFVSQANDRTTDNSIGVAVRYEFFGGGASVSKVNQAHAASAARRVGIDVARYKVRSSAAKAWQNYQAAKLNVESYKRQVVASEISLEGIRQEVAAGTRILLDLLQRQSDLLEAQRKLIEARKNVLLEGYRLMSLMGRLNVDRLDLPVRQYNVTARVKEHQSNITQAQNG